MIQTSDGGYAIAGAHGLELGQRTLLIKTDALGETLWTRTYGPCSDDGGMSVAQLQDGGYVVAGQAADSLLGAYLVRTDSHGNYLRTRYYGGRWAEFGSVLATSDGGFIVAGTDSNALLMKTDAQGNPIWTRHYGRVNRGGISSVRPTPDHGFILAGARDTSANFGEDAYLIKTDFLGYAAIAEHHLPSSPASLSLSASPTLFTRGTVLNYTLPGDPSLAHLEIRDITGRLVRTESPLTPTLSPKGRGGEGYLTWDGTDNDGRQLPSGCYFCTMRVGTQTTRAKVLLTR